MKGQAFSLISGFLAALGATFGKLAITSHEASDLCMDFLELASVPNPPLACEQWSLWLRGGSFILMTLSNGMMFLTMTKALTFCTTSIEASITSAAANFLFTAALGRVLFGEEVTALWWMGLMFILCGLMLLHHTSAAAKEAQARKPGTLPRKKEKLW